MARNNDSTRHRQDTTGPSPVKAGRSGILSVESQAAGRIPFPSSTWGDGTLLELCSLISEQCDPAKTDHEVYIGLEHIDPAAFTVSRFGNPKDVVSSKTCFRKGDILYGKLRPYLDKAVLARGKGICSTDILVFRPREKVCPLFVLALIHSTPFISYAIQTTHGVNHPRTSWTSLRDFQCPIPPLPHQERIAAVLWKIQQAVAIEDGLVRAARDLKKSLLRHIFTRGLRNEPLKETEIGPLPESWEVKQFGDFASVITKGSSPRWQGFEYCNDGVLFVRSQNVGWGRLEFDDKVYLPHSFNEKEIRSILKEGDVLINLVGASIGRVALATDQVEGANTNQAVCLVRLNLDKLDNRFVVHYLLTDIGQFQIQHNRKDIARANISLTDVKQFLVAVPPIDEQREIASITQTVDRKIEVHESKKRVLQDLFKTMLHKLMTAQIRVKDMEIDTSEVET